MKTNKPINESSVGVLGAKDGGPKIRSVKFSMAMNVLLTASSMLFGLVTLPLVSHALAVKGYGAVTFAQSTSQWFSVCALLGMSSYGLRECARLRDDPERLALLVRELLAIITVTTAVSASIFAVCISVVPQFRADAFLMWVFLVNMVLVSYGVEWFFQSIEQYGYITARSLTFKAVSLLAVILFVHDPEDYLKYGVILAFSTSASNILNIIRLCRIVPLKTRGKLRWKRHVRPLLVFAWAVIAANMYTVFDSVLLGLLSSTYEVGLYQLAGKLKGVAISAITAAGNATIPRLSYFVSKGERKSYYSLLEKDLRLVMIVGLSAVVVTLLYSEEIILFFSRTEYLPAATPLRIAGAIIFFVSLSAVCSNMILVPNGRERIVGATGAVAVVSSLLLNLLLDAKMGATGAATALLVSEASVTAIGLFCCRGDLARLDLIGIVRQIVLGVILGGIVSFSVRSLLPSLPSLAVLLIGCGTYVLVLLAWLLIHREPMTLSILLGLKRRLGL